MFQINDMPPQIAATDITSLKQVETATVGHFLHSQFCANHIRAVLPEHRVAGTAVTMRIPGADSSLLHYAMDLLRPGDFLVIDRSGDQKHACWGGVITYTASKIGLAGAVIDGPATDFSEVRKNSFPLWCTGPSPITTKLLGLSGELNTPVSVGGCAVEAGDAVLADESGVLFLKPHQVAAVTERALGMQEREISLLAKIDSGESLPELSGAKAMVDGKRVSA